MKIKIAIADDHQLFIDGIKSILSNELDISIIAEATNGLDLIKSIENGPLPNIIVTDIRMPVMDGIAATKVLTKEYPKIPVLALTMYDQSADVMEMLEAGAKGYVTKDVQKQELITALHLLINGEKYFSKNLPADLKNWFNDDAEKIALTRRERDTCAFIKRPDHHSNCTRIKIKQIYHRHTPKKHS